MGPELGNLVVQIGRFVDDHFPGFVACEFVDAENRVHTLVDKVPMVTTDDLPVADSPLGRGLSDWGHPGPYSLKRQVVELDGDRHVHTAAIREPFAQAPALSPLR